MPVRISLEAIFGAAVVFPLEERCRAEERMVTPFFFQLLPVCCLELLANEFVSSCLSSSGTNTIPGGYIPSFYKNDSGSAGHRGRQGTSVEATASSELSLISVCYITARNSHVHYRNLRWWTNLGKPESCALHASTWYEFFLFSVIIDYATWRSGRSQMNPSANAPTANKSTSSLHPRPPLQSIHGRTDWSAKYGHR